MLNKKEIEIFKEILDGSRKRFPKNFWNDNGEEKAKIIFKYLFEEILYLNKDNIIKEFNYKIITKYKLTSPYDRFYNRCVGTMIKKVYPDLIQGQRLPFSKETRKKISIAQKNLSKEKRENITKGARENRYCEEYAKKLSDTKLGEINPKHKLKTEQVIEIKKLWSTNNYSTTMLGEKFGVKRQTIADIVYGRTWKHLE